MKNRLKKYITFGIALLMATTISGCTSDNQENKLATEVINSTEEVMEEATEVINSMEEVTEASNSTEEATENSVAIEGTTLTYIGHATVRVTSSSGKVIYIDPAYYGGDYSMGADLILVTHGHDDHNIISRCTQNENCTIITNKEALVDGEYNKFEIDDIVIEAVPAGGNTNHDVSKCVGYIITVDGITIYHAGDTSMLDTMAQLSEKNIDYAMYPIDGVYNMDAVEATEVANLVGAKNNIPIHENNQGDIKKQDNFIPEGRLVLEYGELIQLK